MEKNNKTKISQILKISFLLAFVLAGFFSFGNVPKLYATTSLINSNGGVFSSDVYTYACVAANNNYACSKSGTDSSCSDATNCNPGTCQIIAKTDCGGSANPSKSLGTPAGAAPQVSITGGAKSQYAIGDQIPISASNLPTDGTVTFKVNGTEYKSVQADQVNGCTINVGTNFQTGANNLTAEIYNSTEALVSTVNLGTITVGSGTATACTGTGQGTCPNSNQTCTNGFCQTTPPAGGQPSNSSTALINPIQGVNSLTDLLVNIMKLFLGIIGVWAVAFIVIGGFRMVVSAGNEEAVLAAKKTVTWAILGLLVAVLSFAIIAIVQDLIGVNVPAPTTTTPPSSFINTTRHET